MKLIYAITSNDDAERVIQEVNKAGYQATKLSSTGGFLKKGNTTLMIATGDDDVVKVAAIIEKVCGKRETIEVNVPYMDYPMTGQGVPIYCSGRHRIEVGGAVIFAVDLCYYNKI